MVARLISGCWAHTASANCSAVRWSSLRSRASITARRSTVILPPESRIASIASSTRSVATLVSVAGGAVGDQVGRGGEGLSKAGQWTGNWPRTTWIDLQLRALCPRVVSDGCPGPRLARRILAVSYTHLTLPTNREV